MATELGLGLMGAAFQRKRTVATTSPEPAHPDGDSGEQAGWDEGDISRVLGTAERHARELAEAADRASDAVRRELASLPETAADGGRGQLTLDVARAVAERIENMREEAATIYTIVERAGARLTRQAPQLDEIQIRAVPPSGTRSSPDRDGVPEGIRLLIRQMAVAGSTDEEIARRLRRDFEIRDPEAVIDAVFGGG